MMQAMGKRIKQLEEHQQHQVEGHPTTKAMTKAATSPQMASDSNSEQVREL